jgi:predicted metal-binding protein
LTIERRKSRLRSRRKIGVSDKAVWISVCVSCRDGADPERRPGAEFLGALRDRIAARELSLAVDPVECLAVCKRAVTVALAGAGKWTYVIGDLDGAAHLDDLIDSALRFAQSENGIVAWKDRPVCFRKGVVSRTPPLP